MTETLSHEDLGQLLLIFKASIELDQLRVDVMPPALHHPLYDDVMWRDWRDRHVAYIGNALKTLDKISSLGLADITDVAATRDPELVGRID